MPYGRRTYGRRRRYYGRRRGSKLYRRIGYLSRAVRDIKRAEEWKHNDVAYAGGVGTTPAIVHVTGINEGPNFNERSGSKITLRSFWLRGYITLNNASANSMVRIFVIMDMAPRVSNANALFTDMLDTTVGVAWNQHRNLDFRQRFRIMKDYRAGLEGSGREKANFSFYIPMKIQTQYSDPTGASGRTGPQLYVVMVAEDNTNQPVFTWNSRLRFIDS